MTNKSISQLTAGGAVSATDLFPDVQTVGVGPVRVTAAQIGDYVLSGSGLTGVLPVSRGGTGLTSLTSGRIPYGAGTSAFNSVSGFTYNGTTLTSQTSSTTYASAQITAAADTANLQLICFGSAASAFGMWSANEVGLFSSSNINFMANGASAVIKFATGGGTERARIDSSGNLLVGTTSSSPGISNTTVGIALSTTFIAASRNDDYSYFANRNNSDGGLFWFGRQGSFIGSISITTTAVAYNQTSDISLKENIAEAPSALQSILSMPVRQFDWKSDGSHTDYGMVAQEAYEYVPEMVTQGDLWSVDYGRITPRLTKAFQELAAKVAALEEQLNG